MKIEDILSKEQLLKLQRYKGGQQIYIPKIQQQMKRNLIIARYKKLVSENSNIKKTVIAEKVAKEFALSLRNFYRIVSKKNA